MIIFTKVKESEIAKMNKVIGNIELTKGEEQTFIWLAGWEESTVDHILSVIEKAARKRAHGVGGYAHIEKEKVEQ